MALMGDSVYMEGGGTGYNSTAGGGERGVPCLNAREVVWSYRQAYDYGRMTPPMEWASGSAACHLEVE